MGFLMLIIGGIWIIAGICLLAIAVVLVLAAGPFGLLLFFGVLKFAWWLAGKNWGFAKYLPALPHTATKVHRKPGKPDSDDPSTYIPHRRYRGVGTSLDDPGIGHFDGFGLR